MKNMLDFNEFDWGECPQDLKNNIVYEMGKNIYEKIFEVEENDIVLDIGASVGPFTYSILHKNPEHVWVIEPYERFFKTLYKNLKNYQVSFVRGGISGDSVIKINYNEIISEAPGIKFEEFIKNNCIEKIDFLKTDCEGGEYLIFTDENFNYIKNNIKKIVGEFHMTKNLIFEGICLNERFRKFRDNFLIRFNNYQVRLLDQVDIKWDLFNEHFLDYYKEVIIHIDNR